MVRNLDSSLVLILILLVPRETMNFFSFHMLLKPTVLVLQYPPSTQVHALIKWLMRSTQSLLPVAGNYG
jgi:hypothetical protein